MSNLSVREMVLYKHGVGFFMREGKVKGTSATLTFRADEVNDILKSLAVFDRAGGQVYGIHYQTPMDKAHRLANTSIHLNDSQSMVQLIQQLRGREVSLLIESSKGTEVPYTARIIGIEQQAYDNGHRYFITVKLSDGMVRVFPLDKLRGFNIRDKQAEQDLSYFLDTSMSEDNRRMVTVRLSEGDHDLAVYYVAPSPTWRVSYRLVAESDADGESGTALLQGWGLFDNRLEEDLEDVRVTLVAGQPISFIYDLYESRIPDRPTVKDEARTIAKPIEFEASESIVPARMAKMKRAGAPPMAMAPAPMLASDMPESDFDLDDMAFGQSTTTTQSTGTTFQYQVDAPVSVKRGESALVPIISEKIPYQRELLYNGNKLENHPVASLRFDNQTGLTLERGPVTVIEDNDYAGEAIIPFVGDRQNVHIPYAVDLSVTVKEETNTRNELRGLAIEGAYLHRQFHRIITTTYTLKNASDKEKVVTIEASKRADYDLIDTPAPTVDLLNERRWRVDVPARDEAQFVLTERQILWRQSTLENFHYQELAQLMDNRYLDQSLLDELKDLLARIQSIQDLNDKIENISSEKHELYAKQDGLRQNMQSLGTTGKEGALRLRAVEQLEASQDRIEAIDNAITDLKTQIQQAEDSVIEKIEQLSKAYPRP